MSLPLKTPLHQLYITDKEVDILSPNSMAIISKEASKVIKELDYCLSESEKTLVDEEFPEDLYECFSDDDNPFDENINKSTTCEETKLISGVHNSIEIIISTCSNNITVANTNISDLVSEIKIDSKKIGEKSKLLANEDDFNLITLNTCTNNTFVENTNMIEVGCKNNTVNKENKENFPEPNEDKLNLSTIKSLKKNCQVQVKEKYIVPVIFDTKRKSTKIIPEKTNTKTQSGKNYSENLTGLNARRSNSLRIKTNTPQPNKSTTNQSAENLTGLSARRSNSLRIKTNTPQSNKPATNQSAENYSENLSGLNARRSNSLRIKTNTPQSNKPATTESAENYSENLTGLNARRSNSLRIKTKTPQPNKPTTEKKQLSKVTSMLDTSVLTPQPIRRSHSFQVQSTKGISMKKNELSKQPCDLNFKMPVTPIRYCSTPLKSNIFSKEAPSFNTFATPSRQIHKSIPIGISDSPIVSPCPKMVIKKTVSFLPKFSRNQGKLSFSELPLNKD